jgi:hypothetical protein
VGLVGVLDQGEVGGAVRIVLEAEHGRDFVDAVTAEVDLTVELLVTAATTAGGDAAVAITAHGAVVALGELRLGATAVEALGLDANEEALTGGDGAGSDERHGGMRAPD